MIFYDTNILLNELQHIFKQKEKFLISSITLKEIEHIKTSAYKDNDIKFRARKVINLLTENEDKYIVVPFAYEDEIVNYPILDTSNDSRIILTAVELAKSNLYNDIIFTTADTCCYHIAKTVSADIENLTVEYYNTKDNSDYCGFKETTMTDDELSIFYNQIFNKEIINPYDMLINEYLIVKNSDNEVIDQYKYTENGLVRLHFTSCESRMFGSTKPKDIYQQLAIDSLKKNKITMIRGAAGTGKSYLSFSYLFEQLEKHNINKIIIFCNTVATSGSARLGFYPGTRDEKLLDSQIGNLLASKLGDKIEAERMIEEGTLVLLPMSDIRGYDTTGMSAGIYITEAQNLDIELMRLALQRIGEDSICILDGDSDAQVDLPIYAGRNNGMRRVSEVFRGDPCYGEVTLQTIHRSHIAELAQQL